MTETAAPIDAGPTLNERDFIRFQKFIYEQAGIDLAPSKRALVQSRLGKRLRELRFNNYDQYWQFMHSACGMTEYQSAVNLLTTNETYFFREPQHFTWLQQYVDTLSHMHRRPIKIWSAACSTGEEPYTIAIALAEKLGLHLPWEIHASDINTRVTQFAKRAIYPIERVQKTPPHLWQKYFQRGLDEYTGKVRLRKEIASRVTFHNVNLLTCANFPHFDFDIIFLRNVLIYFDEPTKLNVVQNLCKHIVDSGYLLIGHSEVLRDKALPLRQEAPSRYQHVSSLSVKGTVR